MDALLQKIVNRLRDVEGTSLVIFANGRSTVVTRFGARACHNIEKLEAWLDAKDAKPEEHKTEEHTNESNAS